MEGDYYINNSPPNLSIYPQNLDDVRKCMSLDAFKFSMHAAQTIYEVENSSAYSKLTSWRIIQIYYAAFFSAHSILRFFGNSFSQLENGHVNHLLQRCNSEAGFTPNLSSTNYLISFSANNQEITFTKYHDSHKGMWNCFATLIGELSLNVLTLRASEQRREELSLIFSQIKDSLTLRDTHPDGNWLSLLRNNVNYKSYHGVWFPFSKQTPSFHDLMKKFRDWRTGSTFPINPNNITNDLERFVYTAFIITDFAISLSLDYQKNAEKPGIRSADFSRLLNESKAMIPNNHVNNA